MSWPIPVQATG